MHGLSCAMALCGTRGLTRAAVALHIAHMAACIRQRLPCESRLRWLDDLINTGILMLSCLRVQLPALPEERLRLT